MFEDMAAADSGMAMPFYPLQDQVGGLTAAATTTTTTTTTDPNHHMLCFMGSSNSHSSGPDPNPTLMPRPPPPPPPPPPAPVSTSNATLLPPPPAPNPSSLSSAPKYKFVTGSPADWSADEIATLNQGLIRYAHEPSIMKYIKIAAMLPTKTIRDVALRCVWTPGKESRRRKTDGYHAGKNTTYSKNKMAVTNIPMPPPNNVFPFSISLHHPSQNNLVPMEVPVLDSATQLLEENNQLLSQIAANIRTLKAEENVDLFLRTNNNIRAISERMKETLGVMDQMPSLPVHVNEEHLSSLVHLHRGARLT